MKQLKWQQYQLYLISTTTRSIIINAAIPSQNTGITGLNTHIHTDTPHFLTPDQAKLGGRPRINHLWDLGCAAVLCKLTVTQTKLCFLYLREHYIGFYLLSQGLPSWSCTIPAYPITSLHLNLKIYVMPTCYWFTKTKQGAPNFPPSVPV